MKIGRKCLIAVLTAAALFLLAAAVLFTSRAVKGALAENADLALEVLPEDSELLKNGYLERYGVPTEKFSYTNNGGAEAGAPLEYAFDRNFGSVWRSEMQMTAGAETNTVDVEFSDPVLLDRILYEADSGWYDRGFPTRFRISLTDASGTVTVLEDLVSEPTSSIVLLRLAKERTVKHARFEWVEITKKHRTCAAAAELVFLQPESDAVEAVQNMFTDYAQLHLAPSVQSDADIEALRGAVQGYSTYESELSALLNRAEQVLAGTVRYDPLREIGTSDALLRRGDVAGYGRSTLKMAWFGTNRQPTGISVSPDDVLTVYVTGEDGDPLPRLVVTQFWGSWSSWRSGEYKLRPGKNVIRPQSYLRPGFTDNAGDPIPAGGPVYLVNPYTEKEQSDKVKVYFEGGTLIPLFREGEDEGLYKSRLADYAEKVALDREENPRSEVGVADVTELLSDNILLTVRATAANTVYNTEGNSPETAMQGWDEYVKKLLRYDGVILEEEYNGRHGGVYDPRAQYLNCNIRLSQPYGAAYAHIEHVGIQVSWERSALLGSGFGWGYTHELGHMMDIGERTVSECSNNMISKYNETVVEKAATRGDFAKTTAALSPDGDTSAYWNTNRGNFIIWWLIESFEIGYWPTLENLYRYEKIPTDVGTMNATEKQVYLSSLAVKYDLSYYFERWGYNLSASDPIFTAAGASDAFKTLMQRAKTEGRIAEGTKPKIWYLDAAEWWARKETETNCYSSAEKPEIDAVVKGEDGYSILIGNSFKEGAAHLGYEIRESGRVVGFTYERAFVDHTDYPANYTPKYTAVAYDRSLSFTSPSAEKTPEEAGTVCKIGTRGFSTVGAAVAAAKTGDTIVLLTSHHMGGVTVGAEKRITVTAESPVTLRRVGSEPLFFVEKGASLTLDGTAGEITLDGNGFLQSSSLLRAEGELTVKGCLLTNNFVKAERVGGAITGAGGAVRCDGTRFEGNTARTGGAVCLIAGGDHVFENCTFKGNSAAEGGGLYNSNAAAALGNCTFLQNRAETCGGAISVRSGGVLRTAPSAENTPTVGTFEENSAKEGGALYADGACSFTGARFMKNSAEEGGAILYRRSTGSARTLVLENARIGETASSGAAVFLFGEAKLVRSDIDGTGCAYAVSAMGGEAEFTGGTLTGALYKGAGALLFVREEMIGAPSPIPVEIETDTPETVLFAARGGFVFPETAAENFTAARGEILKNDSNELCLAFETVEVTFRIGEHSETKRYLPGQAVLLGAGENLREQYIEHWTLEGESYAVGDTLPAEAGMVFTAVLQNKAHIRFQMGTADAGEDFEIYVIPGEKYSLPALNLEKYVLNSWLRGEERFFPYATAVAEGDAVYTAELTKKLAVEYRVQAAEEKKELLIDTLYYAYGEKLIRVDCNDPEFVPSGMRISGYVDRETGAAVSFLTDTARRDLVLDAVLSKEPAYIVYTVTSGGKYLLDDFDTVDLGADYTLSMRLLPYGYHITSIRLVDSMGGDRSFETPEEVEGFVIREVDCVYYILDVEMEKNIYSVTYQYNGETFDVRPMEYGTKLVLEEPESLPERYHFIGYRVGKRELVMGEDGSYEMADVILDMRLGDEIVIGEDTIVDLLVYIEQDPEASVPEDPTPQAPETPQTPETPTEPETPTGPEAPSEGKGGLTAAEIALIAVGGALFAAAAAAGTFFVVRRRRRK